METVLEYPLEKSQRIILTESKIIYSPKDISQLAKTFGKAKGEFEKGKIEGDNELKEFKDKRDKP